MRRKLRRFLARLSLRPRLALRPPPEARAAAAGSRLEIQFHPGDIRKRVRYFFLTRGQVTALSVTAGVLALMTLAGAVLAPEVIGGLLGYHEYQTLEAERAQQGERLRSLIQQFDQLDERGDGLRLKLDQVFLAYGLTGKESNGQGGYPQPIGKVPESIYSGDIQRGLELAATVTDQVKVLATFLDEVRAFEVAHLDQVRSTPSIVPLADHTFVLTSPFGSRRSPFTKAIDFHAGIDLAAPAGTPIHAPADGLVVYAGRYPLRQSVAWWRYGNLVVLRHSDLFVTLFGHCQEVLVRTGQRVKQGSIIALVGSTGWSTNPHLHYEIRRRNEEGKLEPVDPRIYILDHTWADEERLLVRARTAPDFNSYEPLPPLLGR
jgi:murein DD-endopeptidase MepM/ murein hydrolase activator NlpD